MACFTRNEALCSIRDPSKCRLQIQKRICQNLRGKNTPSRTWKNHGVFRPQSKQTGYSIIPKKGPWISMKIPWKIQQNTSMTHSVDSAIRLLFFSVASHGPISGFLPGKPLEPYKPTEDTKNCNIWEWKKTDHLPRVSTKKTNKNWKWVPLSKQLYMGVSPFFWGVRQTNRSHGKTPTSNKLLGSFQLPLGDLRFVEGFQDSHWRPSWNPETGCFNVAVTWILVEYEGKDALVSNNCLKKNKQ